MNAPKGKLILVVGPSGAGKDTVLTYARQHLSAQPVARFPRRVITRPHGPGEDYESVSEAEFLKRDFALSWSAHGLRYGIPKSIEQDLAEGRVVIINVSRAVIADARKRYSALVFEITAPVDILAQRLAARGRETEADIKARLARAPAYVNADVSIMNDSTPEAAGALFISKIF